MGRGCNRRYHPYPAYADETIYFTEIVHVSNIHTNIISCLHPKTAYSEDSAGETADNATTESCTRLDLSVWVF